MRVQGLALSGDSGRRRGEKAALSGDGPPAVTGPCAVPKARASSHGPSPAGSGSLFPAVPHLHIGQRGMGRSNRACPAATRRRRTGTTGCRARRSASNRPPGGRQARDARPAGPAAGWPQAAAGTPARRRARRHGAMAGRVGPTTRRTAGRFGAAAGAPRRIGEGRASSDRRCALPTTAFLDTPMRRPISAVERPSAQRALQPIDDLVRPIHRWCPPCSDRNIR